MSKPITIPIKKHTKVRRPVSRYKTFTVDHRFGFAGTTIPHLAPQPIQDISKGLENPLFVDERLSARTGNWRITPDGDWEELHKEMDNSIDRLFSVLKKSKPTKQQKGDWEEWYKENGMLSYDEYAELKPEVLKSIKNRNLPKIDPVWLSLSKPSLLTKLKNKLRRK